MAKYREIPCKYYEAFGLCQKGRNACHKTYCQHCGKYVPRAKVRRINKRRNFAFIPHPRMIQLKKSSEVHSSPCEKSTPSQILFFRRIGWF